MQTPQFINCEKCSVLLGMLEQVDCSIANLIKNKWVGVSYNVSLYFDGDQYNDLLRYKRILYRKITSPDCISISNQDLTTLITKVLYKISKCPKCPC